MNEVLSGSKLWYAIRLMLAVVMVLFSCLIAHSQDGKLIATVRNCATREPIVFAHILLSGKGLVAITDIDGRFTLEVDPIDSLQFSALGFQSLTIRAHNLDKGTICLSPASVELDEVVVTAGENPAHRIIRQLITHAATHHHLTLKSYQYTAYDLFVAGFDTTEHLRPELAEHAQKNELMVMETVSEKYFKAPAKQHEKVIATQVSGLKDPLLFFLMSQWQTIDFYAATLQIAGQAYVNPISSRSIEKYHFILESALPDPKGDTVFHIRFYPREGLRFNGLRGEMKINGTDWAVQTVTASTARNEQGIKTQIQQMYNQIEDHWFPVQLKTRVSIRNNMLERAIMTAYGVSYLKDIRINQPIDNRLFRSGGLEVDEGAAERNSSFWTGERTDSLSPRLQATYRFMDSIVDQTGLDKILYKTMALMRGKLPIGPVDLQIDELILFNDYEGFKPKLDIRSNHLVSNRFGFEAAVGFATRTSLWSYSAGVKAGIDKRQNLVANLHYYNDYLPTGRSSIPISQTGIFSPEAFRNYFINRMDHYQGWELRILWQPHPYWQFGVGGADWTINPTSENSGILMWDQLFNTHEFRFTARFANGERWLRHHWEKVVVENPTLLMTVSLVHNKFPRSQTPSTNKIEWQAEKTWYFTSPGRLNIRLEAAHSWGSLPYPLLFNLPATYRPFSILAPYSFGTMRTNEFMADSYVSAYIMHNLGKLISSKRNFAPELSLLTNASIGQLKSEYTYEELAPKAAEKGYIESGLAIGSLIKTPLFKLGVGALYRYGPYRMEKTFDNLAMKLVIETTF